MDERGTGEGPAIEELYARAAEFHGHVCPGTVLGTRMAVLGMGLLGLTPGLPEDALTTYVETARCATDAIESTTRCTTGRHSLRVLNFGKMAATFAREGEVEAVRVVALESSRLAADRLHPEVATSRARQVAAYRELPDSDLFRVERVRLKEPPQDPHKAPRTRGVCPRCAESFEERRGVRVPEGLLCASCAGGAYFEKAAEPLGSRAGKGKGSLVKTL
ncbi:MAG TPA: FmdE family protein [Candidatus Thermoplasmatota archaeon]|nr:FmdE family protein [Candidatus Thermoplasmatota archaeon]